MYDQDDEELFVISKSIGIKTNNQAEYTALIEGLTKAIDQKIDHLSVHADSELMVRQMLGEYKVKNPDLKQLWSTAQALFKQLHASISHVRREQNKRADELANEALDAEDSL